MKRKDSDLISTADNENRTIIFDDSDSVLRTSLRGFFTGRAKDKNSTLQYSSNSTRETNEYSSLVTNNDQAFAGNPLRALKHNRRNMFTKFGESDIVEAKGIEQLINDFNSNTTEFKKSMKSIDFSEKL